MHRTSLITAILTALFVVTAALGDDPPLALGGLDPVKLCTGHEVDGDERISTEHAGFVYRFASSDTYETFLDAPSRWCIQLDGACGAMPTAKGKPDRFAVHEGRIYIFGSDHCRTDFLADPAKFLERERMTVAILVFDGVELLDFAGPTEVFAAAGRGAFDVYTVAETRKPIVSQGVVTIMPEHSFESAPQPDILVIPGGGVGSLMRSEAAGAWIIQTAENCRHVLSVCNGALVLANLGLLDGLEATTHHGSMATLKQFDRITVDEKARYVDNGKIITTAGVSAGIDGALHLVQRLLGTEEAKTTAWYMEYERREAGPAGSHPDHVEHVDGAEHPTDPVR